MEKKQVEKRLEQSLFNVSDLEQRTRLLWEKAQENEKEFAVIADLIDRIMTFNGVLLERIEKLEAEVRE